MPWSIIIVASPLSASLITIDVSFAKVLIASVSIFERFDSVFFGGSKGKSSMVCMYFSRFALRFLGGTKSLRFHLREISSSSMPSKYSASLNFRVNS